uniref:Amphiphysin n=1 Tax=Pundamilia nyererei TaxID=303518 RepID=A0A3B4FDK0_9CICH
MAEIKTGIFAKNVQKRLNRAQEKVLQKLGKADETKDEQFEQVVINFRRQETEGSRLQREMKAYMSAIKGMQQASINLTQSLHEVYEPDWHGKDDVLTIGKDCDALWEDFHNKLVDSTLLNLDAYLQQFPDLKTRVAKRSRKLIDYDSARHHMETMQTSGMKNDRKMIKAEEELKKAQKLKKGPPVPPPPKVTPTKEVAEEQIIDLFGGEFLPAPSPSQPNERPGESLLDLDFDAFQPDESVSPVPQVPFITRKHPHIHLKTIAQAADTGFVADWSADFGSVSANGEDASGAEEPAIPGGPTVGQEGAQEGVQGETRGWPQGEGIQPGGESTAITRDSEITPAEDEVSCWESQPNSNLHSSLCCGEDDSTEQADSGADELRKEDRRKSTPGLIFTNEYGEQIEEIAEDRGDKWSRSPEGSGSEYETAEEWGDGGQGGGWASADDELSYDDRTQEKSQKVQAGGAVPGDCPQTREVVSDCSSIAENMPIPSVVIEPASSNEGDDDRDADIISPTAISDNGVTTENQNIKHISPSGGASGLPDDFLYKVETIHDFEAANSDELDLKRGDVVLVVPTASVEDQDAGWLTGIKESDWLTFGAGAQKGLFPENFTQHLE